MLLQVAQVSLTVTLFIHSLQVSVKGPSLPTLRLELVLLLWQQYLKNGLCSLKTCRCLALAEVRRVNKVFFQGSCTSLHSSYLKISVLNMQHPFLSLVLELIT